MPTIAAYRLAPTSVCGILTTECDGVLRCVSTTTTPVSSCLFFSVEAHVGSTSSVCVLRRLASCCVHVSTTIILVLHHHNESHHLKFMHVRRHIHYTCGKRLECRERVALLSDPLLLYVVIFVYTLVYTLGGVSPSGSLSATGGRNEGKSIFVWCAK